MRKADAQESTAILLLNEQLSACRFFDSHSIPPFTDHAIPNANFKSSLLKKIIHYLVVRLSPPCCVGSKTI